MNILSKYLNQLNESKTTTSSKVTRDAKINRAIGSLAVNKAKVKNDPLYKRMMYFKSLYKKYKEDVKRKYGSSVRTQAQQ